MKIAKEYTWEMGHRLSFHEGLCKNLHGHTYKMIVELEGTENQNGIVIDFYDLDKIIHPIIENLDHSCIAYKKDKDLVSALVGLKSKTVLVDFHTTVENISKYILLKIKASSLPDNIRKTSVRLYETPDAYAEATMLLKSAE